MAFTSSSKREDVSVKLRTQNYAAIKEQTKQLEIDNQKMENQLYELKLAMSREKAEREQLQGNNFWQSGQIGSLRTYGKDVLIKPTKPDVVKPNVGRRKVKLLKHEPIVVPERPKGPGTMAFLAQKTPPSGINNKKDGHRRCGQCEQKTSQVSCIECGEDYCAGCFAAFHLRGALRKHRSIPVGTETIRTPRAAGSQRQTLAGGDAGKENIQNSHPTVSSTAANRGGNTTALTSIVVQQNTPQEPAGSFLDGAYSEAESAASFQEAVKAWRQQPSDQTAPSHQSVGAVTSCAELGTSTDDSAVSRLTPLEIKFTPSLTYAEKLLLKKHRRLELPSTLATSRSCGSVMENNRSRPDDILTAASMPSHDGVCSEDGLCYSTPNQGCNLSDLRRPTGEIGQFLRRSKEDEMLLDSDDGIAGRTESRLSILEVTEMTTSDRLLDRTNVYSVTEVADNSPAEASATLDERNKKPRSAFTRSAQKPSSASPRPPPRRLLPDETFETPVKTFRKSKGQDGSAAAVKTSANSSNIRTPRSGRKSGRSKESGVHEEKTGMQIATGRGLNKSTEHIGADKLNLSVNLRKEPKSTKISTNKEELSKSATLSAGSQLHASEEESVKPSKDNIKSTAGRVSAADRMATPRNKNGLNNGDRTSRSRPSSRLSIHGDGILTKGPSEALHMLSTTSAFMDHLHPAHDLGSYFTLGLESEASDAEPKSSRNIQTPRPSSSRAKVSNQLYQLGPRSWKPDFSLAQTVTDTQAQAFALETSSMADVIMLAGLEQVPTASGSLSNGILNSGEEVLHDKPLAKDKQLKGQHGSHFQQPSKSSHTPRSTVSSKRDSSTAIKSSATSVSRTSVSSHRQSQAVHETSKDPKSRLTFSLKDGVKLESAVDKSYSAEIQEERCVTPNMMVPRHSTSSKPATSRVGDDSNPLSHRPVTPASGRVSQLIVDGDDLSSFDVVDNVADEALNEQEVLETLHRELTLQSVDGDSRSNSKTPKADDDNARTDALVFSEDFDVTSALRESVLMHDFEEMEAEIMQQEVKALP